MNKLLFKNSDWNDKTLYNIWSAVDKIGQSYGLDYYTPQIEVISSEQMLDAYCSHALPVLYNHWSFGKRFIKEQESYLSGKSGLAFEVVINSSPSICYVMDNNTAPIQALVIAHAAVGHSSFFKTNYLFKDRTDAPYIIQFLKESKAYITECENLYGITIVAAYIDACHALSQNSVDYSVINGTQKKSDKIESLKNSIEYERLSANELFDRLINKKPKRKYLQLEEPTSNLLQFFEENSPFLEPWQIKISKIIRYLADYFFPQYLTKVSNEGWATFWHYTILNDLFDSNQITEGHMIECLDLHSSVVYQPGLFKKIDSSGYAIFNKYWSGLNPYALGFNIYQDIRRISTNPTEEDRQWLPDLIGRPWLENVKTAMANFRDESFISQYLSPTVARKMKLACFKPLDESDDHDAHYIITGSTDKDEAFKTLRNSLSKSFNINKFFPLVKVRRFKESNELEFTYESMDKRHLDTKSVEKVIQLISVWFWRNQLINYDALLH